MSKPMITQKQADVIKTLYEDLRDDLSMSVDEFIDDHADGGGYKPLNDLNISVSLLAKYFYIGCEIIPEFKVGDWVYHTTGKVVRQITAISKHIEVTDGEDEYIWGKEFTRHATPKEIVKEKQRKWWKSHNRDVLELREKDIIKINGVLYLYKQMFNDDEIVLKDGRDHTHWQTAFTIKQLYELGRFEVICFAEDRKDV